MSSPGETIKSDADNTKELVKSVNFLAGEVAVFKEALNSNISNVNGTLGITNKSVKELRDSINNSTNNIISFSQKLADSQNRYSKGMLAATFVMVIIGLFQAMVMFWQFKIMRAQSDIMKNQADFSKKLAKFELRPTLEIEPQNVQYAERDLILNYFLFNSGKSKVLNIVRCHSLDLINKSTNEESKVKQEVCVSNQYDKALLPDRPSLIHQDNIGKFQLTSIEPSQYFRINLKVDYETEDFLGEKCSLLRSFELISVKDQILIRPSSYQGPICN